MRSLNSNQNNKIKKMNQLMFNQLNNLKHMLNRLDNLKKVRNKNRIH